MSILLKKKSISILVVLTILISMVGIIGIDTSYAASKKIHLKKASISLDVGNSYQQKLLDKKGKTIKATKVKWKSSNSSVAKIDKKGKITAVMKGTAKMTAKYKGKTYKFKVKVSPIPNTSIYFENPETSITVGNRDYVRVFVDNNNDIICTTNNDNVSCSCDETYSNQCWITINAIKAGESTITVTDSIDNSVSAELHVIVTPDHNTSIKIEPSSLSLEIGETKTVNVITDLGYGITYHRDNNNVSCSWGDWNSKSCSLTIKGLKAGTSVVEVYDTKDNSVRGSIAVTVNPEWTITCKQSLPTKSGVYYSSGKVMYMADIEAVTLTPSSNYFTIEVTGTMITYNGGGGGLSYRVYDQDGYVVEDSIISSNATSSGMKFKAKSNCYLTNPKGSYTLEFYIEN